MNEKEKLIEQLSKIDYKALSNTEPIFTEEEIAEYKKCGLSDAEIANLEQAETYARIIEVLPKDDKGADRLEQAVKELSSDSNKENINKLLAIANNDPVLLAQLFALSSLLEPEEK